METLKREGYLVFALPKEDVKGDRSRFLEYISNIPELKSKMSMNGDIGAGSFGALNFASAYHNPAAISCDIHVYDAIRPILSALAKDLGKQYMELIPDRLCYRTQAQTSTSYHYDASSGALKGDCFFGTIYNMNDVLTQKFTCVPRTHKFDADLKGGAFNSTDENANVEYKKREVTVSIPPGHACIFFENIIHRVSSGRAAEPILRKFVGFRLSHFDIPWLEGKNYDLVRSQGALYYKGGEIAPMYPRLYITNHVEKLQAFAEKLRPEMLVEYTFKSGKRKNMTVKIPHLFPLSLENINKMYPIECDSNYERFKIRKVE
jgi:hypothetical protein